MRWFRNLNTHNKLLLAFALLTLAAALASSWTIFTTLQLYQGGIAIQTQAGHLERTANAQTYFQCLVVMSRNYWLTRSPFYQSQAARYQQQIDQYLRQASAAAEGPDEREDLDTLNRLLAAHATALQQIGAQLEGGAAPASDVPALPEEMIMQADQSANQVLIHLQNMAAKRALQIQDLSDLSAALARRLVFAALLALTLLSLLAILAARVAKQVSEPILHLTNAVVSFESDTFQPGQLEPYNRSGNEMGQMARAFTAMAASIIETLRLKDQFINAAARFVPSQYLDLLEKDSLLEIKLGEHVSAEMAVMFSDLRGFTTFSERMTPQQNFDFINEYLQLVSPIIQRHDGFIVKFLGDGMMAIFPYGADSAVQAGIEKQGAVREFNTRLESRGAPPIQIGIGIHSGHMMVGIVGEELRMQGDAFSDTVNLTSRIEGLNKYFGTSMIITTEILMRLQTPVSYYMRYLGKVEVKGRDQPIGLHEIYDGQSQEIIAAKSAIKADFERGLKAYAAGRFSRARKYFAAVLERAPADQAAALYARRVKEWMGKEPPEDWEGVEVMKDK